MPQDSNLHGVQAVASVTPRNRAQGLAGLDAMESLSAHPLADLFPMMEGEDFAGLVADIRDHGLVDPIVLHDQQILDGRNRYRACLEAGVEPRFSEFEGDDPTAFVVSANLRRRHLNESQRAMVAAKLATTRQGQRTDLSPIGEKSPKEAAALLNVGKRSVDRARTIQREGVPELAKEVEAGLLPVSTAAEVAKLPTEVQREILEAAGGDLSELRQAVIEAAARGLRGGGRRRANNVNPHHEPNPQLDVTLTVVDSCVQIAGACKEHSFDYILGGFLDEGMRTRSLDDMREARDYLARLLEIAHAQ